MCSAWHHAYSVGFLTTGVSLVAKNFLFRKALLFDFWDCSTILGLSFFSALAMTPPDLLLFLSSPCFSSLLPSPVLSSPLFPSSLFLFPFSICKTNSSCQSFKISIRFSHPVVSTLCDLTDCSMPGFPVHHNSWSLLQLMSFESVMPSNYLILCHPLLLPSIFPSIRVFSKESVLHIRWPRYWSFSFSISPSNEYQDWFALELTGLISLKSKGLSRVFSNTTVQRH